MYSCSELGLGHVSRTIALGRQLEAEGHEVSFFSGGEAHRMLQRAFKNVYSCTPVAWYENARGISFSLSLANILFPLPSFKGMKSSVAMETIYRYYDLRHHIKEIAPELLISDGDIHALRLSKKWRIPSVYIANILRPSMGLSPLLNTGVRLTERYIKKSLKIIVPDNPPPFTICELGLGEPETIGIREKVEFVGSFVDTSPVLGSKEHIFAPISGPLGTRAKLKQMLIPSLAKLPEKSVVSLGEPGEKKTRRVGNCSVHTWLSSEHRMRCMRDASLIIFSGGHSTCFEIVKYAKPSICVPTQLEQLANGIKLESMHCSIVASDEAQLVQAIKTIQHGEAEYRKNAEKLRDISNKSNGVKRAANIINTVLE